MKLIKEVNLIENKKFALYLNLAAIPLLVVMFVLFTALAFLINSTDIVIEFGIADIIITLILLIITLLIHELIHGLFFKVFNPKGKVKFGFKNGMAYATSPKSIYTKGKFSVILLTPFMIITLALIIIYYFGLISPMVFIVLGAIHASGCIGDFYFFYLILRTPKNAYVEDTNVGINFYEKE